MALISNFLVSIFYPINLFSDSWPELQMNFRFLKVKDRDTLHLSFILQVGNYFVEEIFFPSQEKCVQ